MFKQYPMLLVKKSTIQEPAASEWVYRMTGLVLGTGLARHNCATAACPLLPRLLQYKVLCCGMLLLKQEHRQQQVLQQQQGALLGQKTLRPC